MDAKRESNNKQKILIGRIEDLEKKLAIANSKISNGLAKSSEEIELLVAFSEASFEAVFLSVKGICIGQNITAEEMFGYTFEEAIGQLGTNWIAPEDREIVMNNMLAGYEKPYKIRAFRKNGTIFSAEIKGKMITYKGKEVRVTTLSDITEREKVNERLKKSKKKYQDLFEKSNDAILVIKNGKFIDCNLASVELLKYKKKAEILQVHPSELSPEKQPDGRLSFEKADEMMNIAIEKGSHRFVWNHARADGEVFPAEILLTPITNEDGSQIIHVTMRDISERNKREKLQKALFKISDEASKAESIEEYYKSLHEIVNGLMPAKNFYIAIHNEEKDIITFPYNQDEYEPPPPFKLFGNGLTEYVLKKRKSQIITEELDIELQKKGEVGLRSEHTKIWIGIYLKFDGKQKGVLVIQDYENKDAYDDEDVKVLEFVSKQIVKVLDKEYAEARLRKSYEKLSEAKEELELINKNKDRFFSIIAHDLRSPFMALMGISQMISEDMDSMSVGEVKEMTSSIYHSTQNLNKLIENLLNWSRLQMGTFEVFPKKINLKEVSLSVVEILKLAARKKNITIQNNITKITVYADEDCVKTILRNLVNNAIKFTERGGKIKLTAKPLKEFVEITVEDNGTGIREIVLEKLFSITEKVSEVGTEKEVGTGLGLILCKELVEKNNGKIWVESEFDDLSIDKAGLSAGKVGGSKFIFTLPIGNVNKEKIIEDNYEAKN